MKPFDINCDFPSAICRWLHRVWWTNKGTVRQCTRCGACWDIRGGDDRKAVPQMTLNEGRDNEVRLLGLPAILEGTDQIRIHYGGKVVRVTHLENRGPMIKCRLIQDNGITSLLCVHRRTVVETDRDRCDRMGGAQEELIWESDKAKLE